MADPVEEVSRAAAQRLAAELGDGLVIDVEAALQGRPPGSPDQYFDPISLGTLIVSVATLAWTMYKDTRHKTEKAPPADVLARRVRVQLGADTVASEQRDRVIDVVVTEIIRTAPPTAPDP
jgi:hypothetical protein